MDGVELLGVGAHVALCDAGGIVSMQTIERTTKTQIILTGIKKRFRRSDGMPVGKFDVWHWSSISPWTEASKRRVAKQKEERRRRSILNGVQTLVAKDLDEEQLSLLSRVLYIKTVRTNPK